MIDTSAHSGIRIEDARQAGICISEALKPEHIDTARQLFGAYAQSLNFSLCFQGFNRELADLPGDYGRPGGRLLLGWADTGASAPKPSGCVALRPAGSGICEMKRLYVIPEARGTGLGGLLARRVITEAIVAGYRYMRLDTLPQMQAAQGLYKRLGFCPIENYNGNPLPGALFFELDLSSARNPQ